MAIITAKFLRSLIERLTKTVSNMHPYSPLREQYMAEIADLEREYDFYSEIEGLAASADEVPEGDPRRDQILTRIQEVMFDHQAAD